MLCIPSVGRGLEVLFGLILFVEVGFPASVASLLCSLLFVVLSVFMTLRSRLTAFLFVL